MGAIEIARSSLCFIFIFSTRTKQIKNLGMYVDFDQESIKRTQTYD